MQQWCAAFSRMVPARREQSWFAILFQSYALQKAILWSVTEAYICCSIFYRVIHSCHTLAWATKYVLVVVHDVHVMSLCSCHDSIHIVQCMSRESCHVCHTCMSFLSGHHSCSCHIIYVMHACHARSGHAIYGMHVTEAADCN